MKTQKSHAGGSNLQHLLCNSSARVIIFLFSINITSEEVPKIIIRLKELGTLSSSQLQS